MNTILIFTLCFAASLAAELVKNQTAKGYYGSADAGNYAPAQPAYAPPPAQPAYVYVPPPPLQDRNVCDLDASVLLVTDTRRHGHNKAVRVRCSEIASYDEDSCNVCCQHAARRDRNLKNADMFGMLVVVDDFKRNHDRNEDEDGEEVERKKRHTTDVDETYVDQDTWKPDPLNNNLKCVCCAPKRPFQFPTAAYSPAYGAPVPAYGQPIASAPIGYGAVPAAQPVYAQPTYTASAPAVPAYGQPAAPAQPVYQQQPQPTYNQAPAAPAQPVYQQQPQPTYNQAPAAPAQPVYQQQPQPTYNQAPAVLAQPVYQPTAAQPASAPAPVSY